MRHLHTQVPRGIGHSSQTAEMTQVSVDGRRDEQNVVHPFKEHDSATKRTRVLAHATTWMGLENMVHGEGHQTQRPLGVMIHLHEMSTTGASIDTESRLVGARGWGTRSGE